MANIGAAADLWRNPTDPYFDLEHALGGALSGTLAIALCLLLWRMARRLGRAERELRRLSQLEVVCSHCHKIRHEEEEESDPSNWRPLEQYVGETSGRAISHGICPQCLAREFPQYADAILHNVTASPRSSPPR